MPQDSYRESSSMNWLFSVKDKTEETLPLFNDLIRGDLAKKSAAGGITGLRAWDLQSKGFR